MTDLYSSIDAALEGIETGEDQKPSHSLTVVEPKPRPLFIEENPDKHKDLDEDYAYVRQSLLTTLEQAQQAMKGAAEFVNAAPSSRAYEVLAAMIKANSEVALELINLQKGVKEAESATSSKQSQEADVINNYTVPLTASQLLDLIQEGKTKNEDL